MADVNLKVFWVVVRIPADRAPQVKKRTCLHQETAQGRKCFAWKSDGNHSVNPLRDADDAPGPAVLSHSTTCEYKDHCQGCFPSQHN